MLCILLYMIYITLFVNIISTAFILNYMNFNIHTNFTNLSNIEKINLIQTIVPLSLTLLIFFAIPILISFLKLDILNPSKSSSIDKMLFDLWWKNKCHRSKNERNKINMQPIRLYELLDENIKNGTITDCTNEEKELVKNLTKKNDFKDAP
ncbi:Uncharacterised protein [uncultured archaeon]|nr:Uncharacterised protein [uncultured archaeon]